jgi:hypothetical protein
MTVNDDAKPGPQKNRDQQLEHCLFRRETDKLFGLPPFSIKVFSRIHRLERRISSAISTTERPGVEGQSAVFNPSSLPLTNCPS